MIVTIQFDDAAGRRAFIEHRGIVIKPETTDEEPRAAMAKTVQAAEAHLGKHRVR